MTIVHITQLARTAGGEWAAHVTIDGHTYDVDRTSGSWEVLHHDESGRGYKRHVLPEIAALLQERVRKEERKEARLACVAE